MPAVQERMLTAVKERVPAVVEEEVALAPQQRRKSMPLPPRQKREPTKFNQSPNPRRALVVGASDAACWAMQRTLVELLVNKGLMSKRTLCEELRANYVAEREKIGEEAAAHLRIWMQGLGCTDIPDSE